MATSTRPLISREVVGAYSRIDVSCIGDVMHGVGLNCIPEGIFPIDRFHDRKMKLCGPAVTMRQISSRDNLNRVRHEAVMVEHCHPGDVLVIDMGGRIDGSTWGGNVSADAKLKGLAGVVIDGTNRDDDEIIALGFPVFSRGLSLRHTHGLYMSVCINNEPIQIGVSPFTVPVFPGDLVVGDSDGVVVVPGDRAAELLPRVQERHEMDQKLHSLMLSGVGRGDSPEVDKVVARVRELEGVKQADGYRW